MNYPRITLPEMLGQTAANSPSETALIYFGARISYAQLQEHIDRLAAGLRALGLQKGDRVALFMPNCPQFVIGYFGVLRADGIVTATSPMYTPREAGNQWKDAGASMVIADRRLLPVIQAALPELPSVRHIILTGMRQYYPAEFKKAFRSLGSRRANACARDPVSTSHEWLDVLRHGSQPKPSGLMPSDIACLQYTGGTTGTSKGAMLTHANLVVNACQTNHWLTAGAHSRETMVAALPLFHIYAMTCTMLGSILHGGTVIILPRFELKAALNIIRKYRPTIFHGVPTMYLAFSGAPNVKRCGFDSLRVCMSGGGPLPIEVRHKFETITGGKLVEGYGLTETSPVTHINPPAGSSKVGSIGLPVADTEARIMDLETGTRELPDGEIGEIVIRGPQVMQGYWNKPEETALALRDGWLYTGDIAKRDSDGYFYIVDRKKDMIIASGYKVYPREVEEVLFECPCVKEAGVVGAPDDYRGETVKAFVVLKDSTKASAEDIINFCRKRLAPYKVPRQVVFRDALPRSGVGKYLRRELRRL
ncbi:MAG TPA: long-chain fatty acid--CoA ligase [Terriglobia bacterium]|nr:long-chain fatty acid--CoA ligase [Terriglobia bacterium]